jgi:hypothetical protein
MLECWELDVEALATLQHHVADEVHCKVERHSLSALLHEREAGQILGL